MDVFDELARLRSQGRKCALATVVGVRGSVPSFETAKMPVRGGGYVSKSLSRVPTLADIDDPAACHALAEAGA